MNRQVNIEKITGLLENTYDTCVLSCLQQIMGRLYCPAGSDQSAIAALGSYLYLGGEPDEALLREAMEETGIGNDKMHLVVLSGKWEPLIESLYRGNFTIKTRYALARENTVFDTDMLRQNAGALPREYELKKIDRSLFERCAGEEWSRDFVCNYDSFALFEEYGLGYVITRGGEPVAGASSYSGYREGIEISIATKEAYRRQGLAKICASRLILACVEKGWYPNWDAANEKSLNLARQLGYHFAGTYSCYEVNIPYLQKRDMDI